MGISLKTKGSFEVLNKNLKKINEGFETGKELEKIAAVLNSSISTKVLMRGLGTDDQPMIPYSDRYATFKRRKGFESRFRNLSLTGQMWGTLRTSRSSNEAKMFFGNAEGSNKAFWNQKRDEFFGLGQREKDLVRKLLRLMINRL